MTHKDDFSPGWKNCKMLKSNTEHCHPTSQISHIAKHLEKIEITN